MRMSDLAALLQKVHDASRPHVEDLVSLLSLEDEEDIKLLFSFADQVRRRHMGDGIFLRGIVEFSNYCTKSCAYCGLNKTNKTLSRYRMTADEILAAIAMIVSQGLSTVVLQSGEDDGIKAAWLADVIGRIKARFDIAITLSIGERPEEDYRAWKEAGADRYLLKIETTDPALYAALHPDMNLEHRRACLDALKRLGYQTGSGSLIGLKGQTLAHIASDIFYFQEQNFDMIGIGPFIPHPATDLGQESQGDASLTLKAVAITRIVTKTAHIPATTALGSLGHDFRPEALAAGANVMMPNFTPAPYRQMYEIYPNKRCVNEPVGACGDCLESMACGLGRHIDYGRGDSVKHS